MGEPLLLALRIRMKSLDVCGYPAGGGLLTHAAVLRLIESVDPIVSQRAHDREFPVTTSGLRVEGRPALSHVSVRPDASVWMRVTVAGQPACFALLRALSRSDLRVDLGRAGFVVTGTEFEPLACANPITIDELADDASSRTGALHMEFVSPTNFSRKGAWLAMPSPENVFGGDTNDDKGLIAAWNSLGGSELGAFSGKHIGTRLVEHHSCRAKVRAQQADGDAFTGSAVYTALTEAEQRSLWALGLLAQFAGVGASRSAGMGQVAVCEVAEHRLASGAGGRHGYV